MGTRDVQYYAINNDNWEIYSESFGFTQFKYYLER